MGSWRSFYIVSDVYDATNKLPVFCAWDTGSNNIFSAGFLENGRNAVDQLHSVLTILPA